MRVFAAHTVPRGWWFPLACGLAAVFAISGCGHSAGTAAGSGGTVIGVSERDFHISTTLTRVPAGELTLRIQNQGPDQHELIVAPDRRAGLPLRSDGFTISEESIQNSEPGSITPQEPGHTENLAVHLAPGRYVLFCNMEGHYMGGMHTVLVVG